jgi:hypothetical protein
MKTMRRLAELAVGRNTTVTGISQPMEVLAVVS